MTVPLVAANDRHHVLLLDRQSISLRRKWCTLLTEHECKLPFTEASFLVVEVQSTGVRSPPHTHVFRVAMDGGVVLRHSRVTARDAG